MRFIRRRLSMQLDKIKVLIVEDQMIVAENVGGDLRREGVNSIIESDPNLVMEVYEKEKPEVVFMDVNLVPGDCEDISGITLGKKLEKLGVIVIYMTAYISTQVAEFGLKYIVHKPYVDELVQMFKRAVLCYM